MLNLNRIHHIAIICKDIERSKLFYTAVLGFEIVQEVFREDRQSHKIDLSLNGQYMIELFSFPNPPNRPSRPEALGLRHLAFEVDDIDESVQKLADLNVAVEDVRIDEYTGRKFTFFEDPDHLPIELYEK